jgi:uncharacterized membrane protein (UPF0127 family)
MLAGNMERGYIYIDANVFPSLLAISAEEQSRGLMYQEWPPPIMSFIYAEPQVNKFWMKNTPSPLDIVFCCNGKVSQICYGEPLSTSIIGADKNSDLIIELPHGTVDTSGIKVGHSVGIVLPTETELKRIIAKNTNNL